MATFEAASATATASSAEERSSSSKLVLITGVSRGLGRALAMELARRGHTIAGCARNGEALAELEKLLVIPHPSTREDGDEAAASPRKHLLKQVDVSSDRSVEAFAKIVVQTLGVPDIIVNNAGIVNPNGKIWQVPAAEFDAVIDVNIKGSANVIRHFLPLMNRGIIVNLSSICGRAGGLSADPDIVPYCASKFGIEGLTQAVSKDVPEGVAIIAAHPGVICTDMLIACFGDAAHHFPTAEIWAPTATDFILRLTPADNGASLSIPQPQDYNSAIIATLPKKAS